MARAAGYGRARLRLHLALPPGPLGGHGFAASGSSCPDPDGALGTRARVLGRGGRQPFGPGQARRQADRPQSHRRGKAGINYHGVVATDGIPLAAVPSAANLHDTRLFRHLLQLAQIVGAAIAKLLGDAGYDSADISALCLRHDIRPCIRKVGEPHGSGLGAVRYAVEHSCAWLLANKRLDRRQDRLGRVILALPTAACIFIVANCIGVF
jgi:hypothetical protein